MNDGLTALNVLFHPHGGHHREIIISNLPRNFKSGDFGDLLWPWRFLGEHRNGVW